MHHKIFFEILDGSQNIFLCSIFVFLFFKLRVLWSTKYPNYPSRRFKKDKTCLINYIHSADITQIVLKIKKKGLMHFDPDARVLTIDTRYNFNYSLD